VGIVLYDGHVASEVVGPYVVFARAAREPELAGLRVSTVAAARKSVRSSEGLRLLPDVTFAESTTFDVLVVPAGDAIEAQLRDEVLIRFLAERGRRKGTTTVGVCSGVHLLGAAGLLDGRRVTTFPGGEKALQSAYPEARVVEGDIVRDGDIITVSGELVAWKAALDLVVEWAGKDVARRVADGLFVDDLARLIHSD
jgi:transcriptional regulator GlxA family with amidase domain